MKRAYIYIVFLIHICIASCSVEEREDILNESDGYANVVTQTRGDDDDKIYTIRFIVFKNATYKPELEYNEKVTNQNTHSHILKLTQDRDKMIIAVVNEPATLTDKLDNIKHPSEAEDLKFEMSDIFNDNHTQLVANTGLPMTGVCRGIEIKEENNTETSAKKITIHLERSVARVELWLKTENAETVASITPNTKISLLKSHTEGYLIAGTRKNETRYQTGDKSGYNFGHWLTVPGPNKQSTWTSVGTTQITTTDELVCYFYTPERTSSAPNNEDKLKLKIENIQLEGNLKHAEATLEKLTNKETNKEAVIDSIKRNNIYQVIGNVSDGKLNFTGTVASWEEAGQSIIIDPQYYLKVSQDEVWLAEKGSTATITAETNYNPEEDLGFPKGIYLVGNISYFNADGSEVEDIDKEKKSDWLEVTIDGNPGDLTRNIEFKITKEMHNDIKGCYATLNISAGNLNKKIRITRRSLVPL